MDCDSRRSLESLLFLFLGLRKPYLYLQNDLKLNKITLSAIFKTTFYDHPVTDNQNGSIYKPPRFNRHMLKMNYIPISGKWKEQDLVQINFFAEFQKTTTRTIFPSHF